MTFAFERRPWHSKDTLPSENVINYLSVGVHIYLQMRGGRLVVSILFYVLSFNVNGLRLDVLTTT